MPVRPDYFRNGATVLGDGHYDSSEATTAGHRRMSVRGRLLWSDQVLLISVVVGNGIEGSR